MIATIDVGLKNLAICVMNCDNKKDFQTYNIPLWEVFNLLDDTQHTCEGLMKNGKTCGKKCLYKYKCKLPSKVEGEVKEVKEVTEVTEATIKYSCKTHFPKDIKINNSNKFKPKKVQDYLLQEIAEVVIVKLNEILIDYDDLFQNVGKILIELQPKINNKMKFVSHIIYSKFVEYYIGKPTMIRFVRASQKLKAYKGPIVECKLKSPYSKRKFLSIEYTKWFLIEKFYNKIAYDKFMTNSKKDDLGDVFLMAINALQ